MGELREPPNFFRLTVERTSQTYVDFTSGAGHFLSLARDEQPGSFYFRVAAAVFAAFAVEAYLNDLGAEVFTFWKSLERLGARDKAEVLHQRLLTNAIDWGTRPFGSVNELFDLRNRLAHGQTEIVSSSHVVVAETIEQAAASDRGLESEIERRCRLSVIERYVADSRAVIELLAEAHKPGSSPFLLASHSGGQVESLTREEADRHERTRTSRPKGDDAQK